jgi:hypothetical protein
MDTNNWARRSFHAIAAHLSDRAPKHEHQAEAKKEFADDICFHFSFSFLSCLAFRDLSSLRAHFRPFIALGSHSRGTPRRF